MGVRIFGVPLPLVAVALIAGTGGSLQAGYKADETLRLSDFTVRECATLVIPAQVRQGDYGIMGTWNLWKS